MPPPQIIALISEAIITLGGAGDSLEIGVT